MVGCRVPSCQSRTVNLALNIPYCLSLAAHSTVVGPPRGFQGDEEWCRGTVSSSTRTMRCGRLSQRTAQVF